MVICNINYKHNDINIISDESPDMIGIYCRGAYACQEWVMADNERFIVQKYQNISQSFNIFCDGHGACMDLSLSGADNIFCRAMTACWRATIHSMKNVFVTGEYALGWETVSNITGAQQSCLPTFFKKIW